MPLAATSLASGGSTADAGSFATASVSPAANSLLVLYVTYAVTGGTTITGVTGLGLTWTQRKTVTAFSASTHIDCWTAKAGASPGSGTVTVTFGTTTGSWVYDLEQWTGYDTTASDTTGPGGYVVQAVSNFSSAITTAASVAYAAAASSGNLFSYACGCAANQSQAPAESPAWTELADQHIATPSCSMETQVSPDATNLAGSSTISSAAAYGAIGLEIASATAAGTATLPIATAVAAPAAQVAGAALSARLTLTSPSAEATPATVAVQAAITAPATTGSPATVAAGTTVTAPAAVGYAGTVLAVQASLPGASPVQDAPALLAAQVSLDDPPARQQATAWLSAAFAAGEAAGAQEIPAALTAVSLLAAASLLRGAAAAAVITALTGAGTPRTPAHGTAVAAVMPVPSAVPGQRGLARAAAGQMTLAHAEGGRWP